MGDRAAVGWGAEAGRSPQQAVLWKLEGNLVQCGEQVGQQVRRGTRLCPEGGHLGRGWVGEDAGGHCSVAPG